MAREEFDWIDDAFDDKKTAEDMERAKGLSGCSGAAVVVCVMAVITIIAIVIISGIVLSGLQGM